MKTISDALFGKTRQMLLGLLFGQPHRSFYLRELVAAIGGGINQVQRELERLTAAGLVLREPRGRQVWFKANPHSPVFAELKSLMTKTAGLADSLRATLEPFSRQIKSAFIYGSVARGEHDAASDVDVLVVGTVRPGLLAQTRQALNERLGRSVQFVVMGHDELKKLIADRDNFTISILQQPKIWLIGAEADLKIEHETRARKPRRQATAKG